MSDYFGEQSLQVIVIKFIKPIANETTYLTYTKRADYLDVTELIRDEVTKFHYRNPDSGGNEEEEKEDSGGDKEEEEESTTFTVVQLIIHEDKESP